MTIWVYSYAMRTGSGAQGFETEVSRTHPLLILADWKQKGYPGAAILWYKRLDEHDWYGGDLEAQDGDPVAVQKLVDKALDENMGRIW